MQIIDQEEYIEFEWRRTPWPETAQAALAPTPEVFTCPECGVVNRYEQTETQQRCSCGDYFDSAMLVADGWTL